MKLKLLAFLFLINTVVAGEIDGVPMNCSSVAEQRMSKKTAFSMVSACRDRQEPTREHYTFCNGSSCTGFTTTFKDKSCKLSDWWDGQDDQDSIDETQWNEDCLTSGDFKKPNAKVTVINGEVVNEISIANAYKLSGNLKGLNATVVADLVAKKIRQERYQLKYSIDSKKFSEVSMNQAFKELAQVNGESKALTSKELSALRSWNEDKSVSKVFVLNLFLSQQGGSSIEQVYIFVPTESYDSILTINRNVYEE